jgi:hypothetical protein
MQHEVKQYWERDNGGVFTPRAYVSETFCDVMWLKPTRA